MTLLREKKKIVIPLGIALLLIFGVIIYLIFFSSNGTVNKMQQFQTTVLKRGEISEVVSASGTIYSNNIKSVYAAINYPIKSLNVELGSQVKKNQVLATLDTKSLQYDINQAEVNLDSAETSYRDSKKSISESIDSAENSVKAAKIALEKQQINYNQIAGKSSKNTEILSAENALDSAKASITSSNLTVENSELAVRDTEVDLGTKTKTYNDNLQLFDAGVISQSDLDNSKLEMDKSKTELQKAKSSLQDAKDKFEQSNNNLEKAKVDLEIARSDADKNLKTAAKDLENAKVSYESALINLNKAKNTTATVSNISGQEISLEKLKVQLEGENIVSPIDGVVTSVNISEGASPNGVAFEIQDVNDLNVKLNIKEYNLSDVKLGKKVKITTDATEEKIFNGEITYISPISVSESGDTNVLFEAHAKIIDKDPDLKVGMNAYVNIIIDSRENTFYVPTEAVVSMNGKLFVYTVNDGKTARVDVETGLETATESEIKGSGLKDGMIIITTPALVTDGQEINNSQNPVRRQFNRENTQSEQGSFPENPNSFRRGQGAQNQQSGPNTFSGQGGGQIPFGGPQ